MPNRFLFVASAITFGVALALEVAGLSSLRYPLAFGGLLLFATAHAA